MPEFFIPGIKDPKQAEEVYTGIKAVAEENAGQRVLNRRIFRLEHIHKGKAGTIRVGEPFPDDEHPEKVIAILETERLYLVCTMTRGVRSGLPVLVGKNEVTSVELFQSGPKEKEKR